MESVSPQATNEPLVRAAVIPPPGVSISDEVLRTAERLGITGQLPRVIAISRELFGDRIALQVAEDPELENWTHIVVQAISQDAVEETVAREERWCDLMVEHRLSRWFTLMDD